MDGFSGILYIGWVEDVQTMKDKLINGKKIVSRFKGKIFKMIKDAGSKFDDYSISPKIFLHWSYELTEKDFLINSTH